MRAVRLVVALGIVALLATVTVLIVRLNKIAKNVEAISHNVASATEWFSPMKIFSIVADVFKR